MPLSPFTSRDLEILSEGLNDYIILAKRAIVHAKWPKSEVKKAHKELMLLEDKLTTLRQKTIKAEAIAKVRLKSEQLVS